MLHIVHRTVNALLYDALNHTVHATIVVAILGNYSLLVYFMKRYSGPLSLMFLMILANLLCHHMEASAVGISGVWSFVYGFIDKRTAMDHLLYWLPCSLMFVDWYTVSARYEGILGVKLWPWSKRFSTIAIQAHALCAIIGWCCAQVMKMFAKCTLC